jgi:hypothetical protein
MGLLGFWAGYLLGRYEYMYVPIAPPSLGSIGILLAIRIDWGSGASGRLDSSPPSFSLFSFNFYSPLVVLCNLRSCASQLPHLLLLPMLSPHDSLAPWLPHVGRPFPRSPDPYSILPWPAMARTRMLPYVPPTALYVKDVGVAIL